MGLALKQPPPAAAEVVITAAEPAPQWPLPLASPGVRRWVWQHRFGEMLIEVVGDEVFVNGQKVRPHEP